MGLHYHLENNELGLCLECSLMIEGGETGCVAFTEETLETLRENNVAEEIIELFYMGYQLQHFEYFDFNETRAVSFLLTIANYLTHRTMKNYAASKKKINAYLRDNFFYLRQALSSTFITNLLNEADTRMQEQVVEQYLMDIWNSYAEYHEELKKLGSI